MNRFKWRKISFGTSSFTRGSGPNGFSIKEVLLWMVVVIVLVPNFRCICSNQCDDIRTCKWNGRRFFCSLAEWQGRSLMTWRFCSGRKQLCLWNFGPLSESFRNLRVVPWPVRSVVMTDVHYLNASVYEKICSATTSIPCVVLGYNFLRLYCLELLKKDSVSCALVWSGVASKRPAGVAVVAQMALLKDFFVVHPQLPSGVEELPQLFRSLQGQEAVAQPGQVVQQHGGIAKAFFSSALVRPALQCGLRRSAELTSAERTRHEVAGVCQNFHVNVMDLCHWEQKCICILRGERPREKSAVYRTCMLYQPAPISR